MSVELPATPALPCALAIDPGSVKCGVAVVQPDGVVLFRAIVPADSIVEETRTLTVQYCPVVVLIGMGTGSKPAIQRLHEAGLASPICPVDEGHTSEEARARFVRENPARGWERLLPRSLRTPTQPYDDYVAVILAERYWQSTSAEAS